MPAEMQLVALRPGRLDELVAALRDAALPYEDVGDCGGRFYRLDGPNGLVGWGGLERYGSHALLRSVVIPPARRGTGGGRTLVTRLCDEAARLGVMRLWLLTTTAAGFFATLGFREVERGEAPAAIRSTREFRDICPASATCMARDVVPRP